MKFAIFALVACAAVVAAGDIYEKEGHKTDLRIRLGHFKEQPFIDLYKQYATAFVYPLHKHEYAKDDYRNYMPSGAECMAFFRTLRGNGYSVTELTEVIKLDACLGYLFDSDDHDLDSATSETEKKQIATLKLDDNLISLYGDTKINEYSEDAKSCLADLMITNVVGRFQYPEVTCNNHFLQMYLQFAECQQGVITEKDRTSDSYLSLIYGIIKAQVRKCFEVEVDHINQAVRKAFARDPMLRAKLKFQTAFPISKSSSLAKQQKKRMWPTPIVNLLSAAQDTAREINIREVHQLVHGFYQRDQTLMDKFEKNFAKFADQQLKPKPTDKNSEIMVQKRYRDLVDTTCQFFRSSDSETDYDYATPVIRMVQLLKHQDLFDVTSRMFVDKLIAKTYETAPVYLGITICNMLTFTEGTIARPSTNTKVHYTVKFVNDLSRMLEWPDAGYY